MSTKTEIGNVRLYLFWSLLKIPRFFSITGNRKQKIWLKQPKAASALDFSYFQHVSKLVTHHIKSDQNRYTHPKPLRNQGFRRFYTPFFQSVFYRYTRAFKSVRKDLNSILG